MGEAKREGVMCVCGKKEGTHSVGEHSGRGKWLGADVSGQRAYTI